MIDKTWADFSVQQKQLFTANIEHTGKGFKILISKSMLGITNHASSSRYNL